MPVVVENLGGSDNVIGLFRLDVSNEPGEPANDPVLSRSTTLTTNVYVDAVSGNDNNDGLTAAMSLRTPEGVYAKFPLFMFNQRHLIVNLASQSNGVTQQVFTTAGLCLGFGGTFSVPAIRWRGPLMIPAAPTTGPATAALDVVPATVVNLMANGAATPLRTQFNFTTAAPGWTPDDFAGRYFIRVKRAGVLRYFELPIISNDADHIFVDTLGIVGDLLATDTVEVVRPGARLVAPSPAIAFRIWGDPMMSTPGDTSGGANMERLEFASTTASQTTGHRIFDRCTALGLFGHTIGSIEFSNCGLRGAAVTAVFSLDTADAKPRAFFSRPDIPGSVPQNVTPTVAIASYGTPLLVGGRNDPATVVGEIGIHGLGIHHFHRPVSIRAPFNVLGNAGVWIFGNGSHLIMLNGCALIVEGLSTGAPNATQAGIRCRVGSQCRIDPAVTSLGEAIAAPYPTVRPASTNHLQVETGAAIETGTGAGQFNEAAGFNGNFLRLDTSVPTAPTGDFSRIFKTL
jgi:hypothetical protein